MSGSVPSFCSSAFLVRPPDEMGTREHYQRALRIEFTTRCWQLYLAKAGPASGCPLLWSAGLTQCSKRDGVFGEGWPLPRRAGRTVEENPRRTFWSRVGRAERAEPLRQAVPKQARGGHGDAACAGRLEFTAIPACCSCSVGSVAMHAKLPSQSEPSERHRSLAPVAGFSLSNQPDQVRFERLAFR